jgi:addiction module HigA family antidote
MLPENRIPTHPGEVLLREFLEPMGISQVALADHVGISVQRVNELVRGKRGVTPETAWLLAQALGTTPELWVNLQSHHDLASNRPVRSIRKMGKAS